MNIFQRSLKHGGKKNHNVLVKRQNGKEEMTIANNVNRRQIWEGQFLGD